MGLPGSGKTTLASKLVPLLKAKWLNNDEARKAANDWDFSEEGRIRQAKRMADLVEKYKKEGKYNHIVTDYIVWIITIKEGRFDDTNKMFVKPEKFDFEVTSQDAEVWAKKIAEKIK